MGKALKVILLSLMLVSILAIPVTLGCNDDTTEEFSQQELAQILADSVDAMNTIDSYKINMDMQMDVEVEGSDEEGTMGMDMTAEGAIDQKNMEMYLDMEMSIDMDMGSEQGSEEMSMEMYLADNYIYTRMAMLGMDEGWTKMPATGEDLSGMDMFEQQLEPLESPGELKFLGYEEACGSECYVIEFAPDMEMVMELLEAQGLADMGLSLEEADMVSDLFDELAYKCWVDKETRYLMKMSAYILMKVSGDDFEELAGESGSMTMDMDMTMEMYDYNEPANVTVPDEALNAEEMDYSTF